MNLMINGEKVNIQAKFLSDLIEQRVSQVERYAVAVNERFITKADHASYQLKEGDVIELVMPMQGG